MKGLSQYQVDVRYDSFEFDEKIPGLSFPCVVCIHRHKDQFADPCGTCFHNMIAVQRHEEDASNG